MIHNNMTRAALYLRISNDPSGEALGVARQREDCERLALARGWTVVSVRSENDTSASGKAKRPEFDALLADVEADRIQVIVAWSLDRLTRNRRDTLRLIETCQQHAVLIALARGSDIDLSTPAGRVTADILAAMARMEIDQKSDRQKRANDQRAAAGKPHIGTRCFGYEKDGVTIRESEADCLREMAYMFLAGHSALDIARWLNREGWTTTMGNPFYPMTVRGMLQNKRYISIRHHNGAEFPGIWPPVFDSTTWERLQLAIRLRSVNSKQTLVKGRKYLLTGLAFCGRCGMPLSGSKKHDTAGGKLYRVYRCHSLSETQLQVGCGRLRRNADALDEFVKRCVLARLDTPKLAELIVERKDDAELAALLEQQDRLVKRKASYFEDYTDGVFSKAEYIAAKAKAEAELAELKPLVERANRGSKLSVPVGETLEAAWDKAGIDWRRELIGLLVKRITVNPSATKRFRIEVDGKMMILDPRAIEIDWRV